MERGAVADEHDRRIADVAAPLRQRGGRIGGRGPFHFHEAFGRKERRVGDAVQRGEHVVPAGVHPRGDEGSRRLAAPPASALTVCASASSAETATIRRPVVRASPWIVAMPIRRPVNDPGPEATANRSIAVRGKPVRVGERQQLARQPLAVRACGVAAALVDRAVLVDQRRAPVARRRIQRQYMHDIHVTADRSDRGNDRLCMPLPA